MISKINMHLMEKRIRSIDLPIFQKEDKMRQRIIFYGKVKRVAFRNEVYLMSIRLGASGFVYNDKKCVVLEIEAEPDKITYLIKHLKKVPRFNITFIDVSTIDLKMNQSSIKLKGHNMATSKDYMDFVLDQIKYDGMIRYKKMFGEYMIYLNDKPVLMVCDNTVFVKQKEALNSLLINAEKGYPYEGSKKHYVLDIEDHHLTNQVLEIMDKITSIPKKKSKKV